MIRRTPRPQRGEDHSEQREEEQGDGGVQRDPAHGGWGDRILAHERQAHALVMVLTLVEEKWWYMIAMLRGVSVPATVRAVPVAAVAQVNVVLLPPTFV